MCESILNELIVVVRRKESEYFPTTITFLEQRESWISLLLKTCKPILWKRKEVQDTITDEV